MIVKGFFEDYDGEEVLSDVRNYKSESDFVKHAEKYMEETRGYKVPLINIIKTNIIFKYEEWQYKSTADDDFKGREIEVFKADLDSLTSFYI